MGDIDEAVHRLGGDEGALTEAHPVPPDAVRGGASFEPQPTGQHGDELLPPLRGVPGHGFAGLQCDEAGPQPARPAGNESAVTTAKDEQ